MCHCRECLWMVMPSLGARVVPFKGMAGHHGADDPWMLHFGCQSLKQFGQYYLMPEHDDGVDYEAPLVASGSATGS